MAGNQTPSTVYLCGRFEPLFHAPSISYAESRMLLFSYFSEVIDSEQSLPQTAIFPVRVWSTSEIICGISGCP
jgi:hypothetical protein